MPQIRGPFGEIINRKRRTLTRHVTLALSVTLSSFSILEFVDIFVDDARSLAQDKQRKCLIQVFMSCVSIVAWLLLRVEIQSVQLFVRFLHTPIHSTSFVNTEEVGWKRGEIKGMQRKLNQRSPPRSFPLLRKKSITFLAAPELPA